MKTIEGSIKIIDSLQVGNGLYRASASAVYSKMWFRDCFYIILAFLHSKCGRFERGLHGMLDILIAHEDKITYHTKHKPVHIWERIHPRYDFEGKEIQEEWGNAQNDAIGAILFGIGEGERVGKRIIRNEKDRVIVQKLVNYLACCEYWQDPDNGIWEEQREIRSSSIGACIKGLESVSEIVYVDSELIAKGYEALYNLFPKETETRNTDLALLTLIYPYQLLPKPLAQLIISNVENELLRKKGVARYRYDNYFSTLEKEHGRNKHPEFYDNTEPHWVFGFSFLSLAHMTLGDLEKGKYYIERTEEVMLENGHLPELYFEGDYKDERGNNFNINCPLGWTQSMHIQAVEMHERLSK